MTTKIEFYRELRQHLPDEAARLIADEMPTESQLATKEDLLATREDIRSTRDEMRVGFNALALEIERVRSSTFRWALGFFVPLWVGVYATLLAILVRGIHL